MTLEREAQLEMAVRHLEAADPVLGSVIVQVGACTLTPHTRYFEELAGSVIGQQLSVKAAATITARVEGLFDGTFPGPQALAAANREDLRAAGLSYRKVDYIQDLATKVAAGAVVLDHLDALTDTEIIARITEVKGFGTWTVQMFLIFSLGRLDVVASGDLGVRTGVKRLYSLETLPAPKDVEERAQANRWHPYSSVACWYLWQSLNNS